MANNPRQAERETNEAGQTSTRRAAEQTAQTTRSMADATERTARTGAEAVRRNAENLSNNWRSGSEAASRMAERSMDQLAKMFGLSSDTARQTMQRSSGNLQAVIESTTIIAGGLQNVSGEWMRFAQSRLEDNLDRFDELMGCRTVQDCLALQTEIVRDNLEALLQSMRRASELSGRMANDAMQKIGDTTLAPM
ncbi:MAG: phasin family protein [Xanthobacteraceae bacterium]